MNHDKIEKIRHSTSHLLALAVLEKFPQAKLGIGPTVENGFYYDFDLPDKFTNDLLPKFEKRIQQLIKQDIKFERISATSDEAKKIVKNNPYKKELVDDLINDQKPITFYRSSGLIDLCGGPHVTSSREINPEAIKLVSIAGAYWRGDEKNPQLQRIYGVAFETKDELDEYLKLKKLAEQRDHRKIGQELDLFTFAEDVGPGLPLWTPRGTIIKDELEKWAKETEAQWGYARVTTPHIAKHTLYEKSGHLPYYKDDMFSPMKVEGEDYYLKSMNCPHHHLLYLSQPRTYHDLPLRFAEYGSVYRYEQSGALFGLMRVRFIEQNDAHIYCTLEQAEEEFLNVLKLHEYYYNKLGLTKNDYHIVIGLPSDKKKDKYHGDKKLWDLSEKIMKRAIEKSGIRSENDIGGAAFYGPKIDFNIRSSVGREFGISTNQLDLYMPQRFNLKYTDSDGSKKYCAVIHRAPLGSHERFIGFLIEHFAGNFPLWLSPVQIQIITVGLAHIKPAEKLMTEFKLAGIRCGIDSANETVGRKIRQAIKLKIPYILVIGDKEAKSTKLHVRQRGSDKVEMVSKANFIKKLITHINERSIE